MTRTWRLPILVLLPLLAIAGFVTQTTTEESGSGGPRVERMLPTAPGDGALSSTWYCAGGTATGTTSGDDAGLAETTLVLTNATDDDASATVSVVAATVLTGEAIAPDTAAEGEETTTTTAPTTTTSAPPPEPVTTDVAVPAHDQARVTVSDVATAAWAAALVEATGGQVTVEQELRGPTGTAVTPCASSPSSSWYFPAGTTRAGATTSLALFNPFPGEATLDVSFDTDDGARTPQSLQGLVVQGRSVKVVDVSAVVTLRAEVATTVTARTGRVVAEQVQATDDTDGAATGLAASVGAAVPNATWVFPDGTIPAVDDVVVPGATTVDPETGEESQSDQPVTLSETYAVFNPGDADAEVEVQVVLEDPTLGEVEPFRVTVPGGRYETVPLLADGRVPASARHWVIVRSADDAPVVVERMVEGTADSSAPGVSLTVGSPVAATRWYAPVTAVEGTTASGLSVANPSATDTATVRLSVSGGGSVTDVDGASDVAIAPGGLVVFDIATLDLDDGASIVVESDRAVVVGQQLVVGEGDPTDVALPLAVPVSGTEVVLADTFAPTEDSGVSAGDVPADLLDGGSDTTVAGGDGTTDTTAADGSTTTSEGGADASSTTSSTASTTTTTAAG